MIYTKVQLIERIENLVNSAKTRNKQMTFLESVSIPPNEYKKVVLYFKKNEVFLEHTSRDGVRCPYGIKDIVIKW